MTTEEIIGHLCSRDSTQVWLGACKVIELSQRNQDIAALVPHLSLIQAKTVGLDLGGAFAPNQRFVDFAIKIIAFHKENKSCSCSLYAEKFKLTHDSYNREIQYDRFDPEEEVKKGNVRLIEKQLIQNTWVDYYLTECLKCGQQFKVAEGDAHYVWWSWAKI